MTTSLRFILALVFVCTPLLFYGQPQSDSTDVDMYTLSLEELMQINVTTASKNSEGINEAPAIISVITEREISSYGALTLVDVINRATALYVTGSYYFPNNLAAIRGDVQVHTSSHVLILIDGRPCRESFYSGIDLAVYNTFPVNAIERIEVIRGPGSVLYGTNAFTGVINIITKQKTENAVEISTRAGSFGTGGVSYLQSSNFSGVKVSSAIQYVNQRGWDFTATDQADVTKTQLYGQENIGATLSATYKSLSIRTFYGKSFRDIWGERPLFPTDGTFNTLNTYRAFADIGYKREFSSKWSANFNATLNSFSQRSLRDNKPVNFHSTDMLAETTHFIDLSEKLHVIAGALLNNVAGEGVGTDPNTNELASLVPKYNEPWWALYTQAYYEPAKFLKIIVGGQYNKVPDVKGNFVPRFGAIVNFKPDFGVKVLYGQAFKSPAQSDRFITITNLNYGNPNLDPETVATTDFQIYFKNKLVQLTAGYFMTEQKNNIVRIAHPTIATAVTYVNQGSLDISGVEFEGRINPTQTLNLWVSYAYQTNENNEGEKDVTAISNNMIRVGISYQTKKFSVGLFNSNFSAPPDVINSQSGVAPASQRRIVNPVPAAFNLLSANINANLTELFGSGSASSLIFNMYVDNLLDEKIYNPEFSRRNINSLPARGGFAAYGGLTLKF